MNQENTMYQVSTLQALLLGYTKNVITVGELLKHGSIGLGTFEDVNGEMIVLDDKVYMADSEGNVFESPDDTGVPFAAVASITDEKTSLIKNVESIDQLKQVLNNLIEEDFGLNSIHVIRLDGMFNKVYARSEKGHHSQHVPLSKILENNQKDFVFTDISGTMVCLYFPDFLDGTNAPGWHLHFISSDFKYGGHVFDLKFETIFAKRSQIHKLEIQLPTDAAFDTYSLKAIQADEIKKVEQSKG